MNISDEAVEAAYDKFFHLGLSATEIDGILEAAAPFIAAEAWDEGFDEGRSGDADTELTTQPANPYRSQA